MSDANIPTIYKAKDFGVFIGLVTTPIDKGEDFWKKEIEVLFDEYRKEVLNDSTKIKKGDKCGEQFHDYMYKPIPYYLFGSFDIGVVCLVENFTLSTRRFHPYSHLLFQNKEIKEKKYNPNNFIYKTINGSIPDLSSEVEHPKEDIKRYYKELENLSKEKPFISIVSLKLNNALLVGSGTYLVNLVLRKLKDYIKNEHKEVSSKILFSWSWNEITLILFSDRFQYLTEATLNVRSLTFGDLKNICSFSFDYVKNNSLYKEIVKNEEKKYNIEESHLFVNTHSTFGFHLDFYFQPEKLKKYNCNEKINFFLRWDVKPGHLNTLISKIKEKSLVPIDGKLNIGKGDFSYQFQGKLEEFIYHLRGTIGDGTGENDFSKHVRKLYTTPNVSIPKTKSNSKISPQHYYFNKKLIDYIFDIEKVDEVVTLLKQLRVSKTVSEKTINMYIVFNDGIQDPVQYGYFIELRPFLTSVLDWMKKRIVNSQLNVKDINKYLDDITHNFILAYNNRFGQTHVMDEISDYNISFNGGIQQLLTAYDSTYKILTNLFGDKQFISFANVTGDSEIESNFYRVKLNYFHLFQPEIFATVAVHEAANFFFQRSKNPLIDKLRQRKTYINTDTNRRFKIPDAVGEYGILDFITFKSAFDGSGNDLFEFWYWNHFLQSASNYGKGEKEEVKDLTKISFDSFIERLFRFRFLGLTSNTGNLSSGMIEGHDLVKEYWSSSFGGLENLINDILRKRENKSLRDPLQKMIEFVMDRLIDDYLNRENYNGEKYKYIFQYFKKYRPENYQQYQETINTILINVNDLDKFRLSEKGKKIEKELSEIINLIYKDRNKEMRKLKNIAVEKFMEGEIVTAEFLNEKFSKDYTLSLSFILQVILLAYLEVIRKLIGGKKIKVLKRDKQGKILENQNGYFMDSFGGIVILDYEKRRHHYMYRTLLILSLWSIGNIFKKRLFSK